MRTLLALVALPVATLALPAFAHDDLADPSHTHADETADGLLVDFKDDLSDADIEAIEAETGLDLDDTTKEADGNLWLFHGDPASIERAVKLLQARRDVEVVEPNVRYALFDQDLENPSAADEPAKPNPGSPNDPMYKSQWHFDMVHAEAAWKVTQGAGVIVAVVDTGVSQGTLSNGKESKFKRVPDLKETELVAGFNFVNNTPDASDGNGHGTHVAGTIAQSTNNAFGVAGLAYKAKIMPIKVLSDGGSGTVADIANGIRWSADHGAKVINMSLGGGMYSSSLAGAVKYAHDKGVTVVCAAGNGARQKVEYPAAYDGSVAVSALGPDGKLAFYSSYGKELDIAAPGGDTRVDLNKDGLPDGVLQDTIARGDPSKHGFFPFQGTSMATPHVAAAAALVISMGVTDPDRVEKVLEASASDMKDPIRFGAGGLDAGAAVKKATKDHVGGSVFIAALLGGLALRAVRKKDGMLAQAKLTPGMVGAGLLGTGAWIAFIPALGAWSGVLALGAGALVVGALGVFFGIKKARMALAGFAFGVAGFFLIRAGLGSVDVAIIPGHGVLDAAWLAVNGVLAYAVGRVSLTRS